MFTYGLSMYNPVSEKMATREPGTDPKHCGLCLEEGSNKDANYYCKNCSTYICDSCKASHSKFKDLRSHKVVTRKSVLNDDSQESPTEITDKMKQMLTKPCEPDNLDTLSNNTTKPDEADISTEASKKPSNFIALSSSSKPSEASLQSDTAAEATTNVFGLEVQAINLVETILPDDRATPNITGICFMPGGELIICDNYNMSIKLLDHALSVKDSFKLPGSPRDVAALDNDQVVVTLPVRKELHFIKVSPSLKKLRIVSVDKRCQGVDVAGDQIFVTCYTHGMDDGEVRVYDISGNVKKKLGVLKDGSFMFRYPEYIAVSRASDKIFVSDGYDYVVYCITANGKTVYKYTDKELRKPRGLCVDEENNVIVCGRLTNNIQILTAAGKNHKTLFSSERIWNPESVAFRTTDSVLVVSSETSGKLFVCKLV